MADQADLYTSSDESSGTDELVSRLKELNGCHYNDDYENELARLRREAMNMMSDCYQRDRDVSYSDYRQKVINEMKLQYQELGGEDSDVENDFEDDVMRFIDIKNGVFSEYRKRDFKAVYDKISKWLNKHEYVDWHALEKYANFPCDKRVCSQNEFESLVQRCLTKISAREREKDRKRKYLRQRINKINEELASMREPGEDPQSYELTQDEEHILDLGEGGIIEDMFSADEINQEQRDNGFEFYENTKRKSKLFEEIKEL